MSASNPNRERVSYRGRTVPNLYQRVKADGTVVFEHFGRIGGGKPRRTILDATNVTEAIEAAESLRSGIRERRVHVAADRRTLVRAAAPRYLAHLEALNGTKAERSPRTIEDIVSKLDLYIVPALGGRAVSAVDERDIRDLARSASGKSRATVTNILSTASGFFTWAVREKLAGSNPVRVAREVYGEELLPDGEPREARALTDDETAAAMEHVGETFAPIVSFTAETGLRISEVLGLLWGRVDLETETITVTAQLGKDGTVRETTKNKRRRVIPISAKAAQVLRAHRQTQEGAGFRVDDQALVFVTKTGQPQSRHNVLRAWKEALVKVGIDDAGLHSLRHSFVSRLAERNVPVAHAAALVGHSRIATTQGHYTHVRGNQDARVEQLREVLG